MVSIISQKNKHPIELCFLSITFFGVLFLPYVSHTHGAQNVLLINNATIVSPELDHVLAAQNVLIEDGRIVKISVDTISVGVSDKVIDAAGKYLTPGIMDSHVHVSSVPGLGFPGEGRPEMYPELLEVYFEQQPRSFLYHGVTQVLDPNPGLSKEYFVNAPQHPDYMRCEVITAPGTFPFVEKTQEVALKLYPYYIIEKTPKERLHEQVDALARTPQKIVAEIAQSGASCVKLYFEDGYGEDNQWAMMDTETLLEIKIAAKEHNLLVLAHANELKMQKAALDADVDVMAHGMWNWAGENSELGVPDKVAETLDRMMSDNVGYMASQMIIDGLGKLMLDQSINDPKYKKVTPVALIEWFKTDDAKWFREEVRNGFGPDTPPEEVAEIFLYVSAKRGRRAMMHLYNAGYPLLLGSDFPGSPTFANQPGLTSFREMELMAAAGVSLRDVLAAATINNAKQFSLDDDYGTVSEGKIANLLILNKNPLENVKAWNDINKVILHGQEHDRDEFQVKVN